MTEEFKLSNGLNCAHFQYGNQQNIAVVFSCPGQEEEKQNLPISGQTGKNLEILLELLYKDNFLNDKLEKKELRVTNAWPEVVFAGNNSNKITEAKLNKKEIYSESNLKRLENELNDIHEFIICFGQKAKKAIGKLHFVDPEPSILTCCHLSLQSLNSNKQLKKDIYGNPIKKGGGSENTKRRLTVVAKQLIYQAQRHT